MINERGEAQTTKNFREAFDNLQPQKQRIVREKISLLATNPRHPSLNVHRVHRAKTTLSIWECYIDHGMRLLYEIRKGILYLWYFGGHEIVDDVHLHSFSSTNLMPWNIEAGTSDSLVVEPINSVSVSNITNEPFSVELFSETHEVPDSGTLNYFAYYPTARLRVLGVPEELISSVKDALSLQDALALPDLPENVHIILEDLSTSPDLEAVLFDSSLLLYRTTLDRLEGYFKGKIKKLMLNLLPEQQQYVDRKDMPLLLLKGVAGCGKTTIGIYRAIQLASQGRRVLVVAFNNVLMKVTKTLIEELIGPLPENLQVKTLDSVMMNLLYDRKIKCKVPEKGDKKVIECLRKALNQTQWRRNANILQRGDQFFKEEIERVIKGLGLKNVEEYKNAKRYGRKNALRATQREVVWEVYQAYEHQLDQVGVNDWSDVALLALDTLEEHPIVNGYNDIIVDEAQDLTPMDLRVIQKLIAVNNVASSPNSILILGDAAQTLYSRGFYWEQAGIQAKGHTSILRKNHRNTRQIAEAAVHLLKRNVLMQSEYVKLDLNLIQRQGGLPKLLKAVGGSNNFSERLNQITLIQKYILDLVSRRAFRLSDIVILCHDNKFCEQCQQELQSYGLRAALRGNDDFSILEEQIKILTIHSAKGLEFPVVSLLGLTEGEIPPIEVLHYLEEEEKQLEIENQRMLCYVGMTRAAEELYLVTVEGKESRFVRELEGKVVLS